jgi:hypothetical protein
LEKLQRARAAVRQGIASQPILSTPGTLRIVVGNWVLNSQKEQHLHINNSEGHQVSFGEEFAVISKFNLNSFSGHNPPRRIARVYL